MVLRFLGPFLIWSKRPPGKDPDHRPDHSVSHHSFEQPQTTGEEKNKQNQQGAEHGNDLLDARLPLLRFCHMGSHRPTTLWAAARRLAVEDLLTVGTSDA